MRLFPANLLPPDWRVASIDELCERVTSGGTPSRRQPTYYDGDIPWVKTQELRDCWLDDTEEHLTEEGMRNSSAKLLPQHTVLMAMYGATVGKLAILAKPMTCNQAACAMIVDANVADYRYVYYQLLRARPQIFDLANGAAQQNLSGATIKSLELPLPPLAEQRSISAMLGALDDKLESNHRAQNLGEELLRSLVTAALEDSEGSIGVLGDYCQLVKDPARKSALTEDVNYIGFEHMPRGSIFLDSWGNAAGLGSDKSYFMLGDVLFGKLRPYFKKVGIAPLNGVCSTDILVLRPKSEGDAAIVAVVASSDTLIDSLSAAATGTRMPRASWEDLSNWPVVILTDAERTALAEQVVPLLQRLTLLTHESNQLRLTRDTLLPELLSGRVLVPESAKVLA